VTDDTSFYQSELKRLIQENGEIHRWMLALGVSIGALMEVIDSSITNVALPHIQGNLGATTSEAAWVITAYSVANVITMPLAVWLGEVFGKKNYFVFSMIGFTVASMACGLSPSLAVLVLSRVLQGLFGGGLLAKAQAFLFESFPPAKQGMIQGLFGICVIVGPIIGPTMGGYLTDNFNWRWIFFINLPIGIIATILCMMFLPKDAPHEIEDMANQSVDWFGILTLSIMLGSFQYVLEKGQDEDWFSSRYIIGASIASVIGFMFFVAQELTTKKPAVDLSVLRHRSVSIGLMFSTLLGFVLFGMNYVLPNFAQSMLGYTALQAGVLQVPSSVVSGCMFPIVGMLVGKVDARIMVFVGIIMLSIASFGLANLTLDAGWDQFLYPSLIRGAGTVLMYLPLTLAAVGGIPTKDIGGASAFLSLTRQMGGSIGIAILATLLVRRSDFHRAVLVEKITPFGGDVSSRLQSFGAIFQGHGQSPIDAANTGLHVMDNIVQQQATIISYEDLCWLLGVLLLLTLPLVFLLSSGKRPKGAESIEMH